MTLNRSGLLFTYLYFWTSRYDRPRNGDRIDLCRLFWRGVLLQPVKLLLAAVGVSLGVFAIIINPILTLGWWGVLILPTGLATLLGIIWTFGKGIETAKRSDLIAFMKGRFCPSVEVRDA